MEVAQSVAAWAITLAVERWPEIVIGIAMIAAWRWFMGHSFKKRIAALERQQAQPAGGLVVHGDIGDIKLITNHYYPESRVYRAELESPRPIRISGIGATPIDVGIRLGKPDAGDQS